VQFLFRFFCLLFVCLFVVLSGWSAQAKARNELENTQKCVSPIRRREHETQFQFIANNMNFLQNKNARRVSSSLMMQIFVQMQMRSLAN